MLSYKKFGVISCVAAVVICLCGVSGAQHSARRSPTSGPVQHQHQHQHQQQPQYYYPRERDEYYPQRRGYYDRDYELQTVFFLGIPLILIPLIVLWPYFLYSLHGYGGHGGYGGYGAPGYGYGAAHHGYGGYGGYGYGRSSDSAKTNALAEKIVPHL